MAQRKRAGLITRRSHDRNMLMLFVSFLFSSTLQTSPFASAFFLYGFSWRRSGGSVVISCVVIVSVYLPGGNMSRARPFAGMQDDRGGKGWTSVTVTATASLWVVRSNLASNM